MIPGKHYKAPGKSHHSNVRILRCLLYFWVIFFEVAVGVGG